MNERRTHVYKTAQGLPIEADVLGAEPDRLKPCVLWIHGGGLIFGSRTISPRPSFARLLLQRGFVIVSIDHRLAPETKLSAIVDDVAEAWRWLHEAGPTHCGADPSRACAAGASAGAYLALLAGHRFTPRPRAIASFWGYGDITAPWEAEPSAHYRTAPLVERADALASLALTPVPTAEGADRSRFYLYCRQQGLWLPEVTGHAWPEQAAWFEPYCPLRNIDAGFPPTVLVHGRADTDVPASESDALANRFREQGVAHQLHALPGVGHGFAGATPEEVESVESAVVDFLWAQACA
ncbi:alpha/beta hydrolase [Aquabacterium humicola]|uniref:alpha/beta hydrolase n=1 Tax=Aquabacterium humicola TaxID=3237377 RepID=UPI002542E72C|nr:alpha/beta hydrolase [Rubrivivax pictus]